MPDESLYSVNLERISLEGSPCDGVCLIGAFLREANFVATSLSGADLSHSNLEKASMRFAKMQDAVLIGTIFTEAGLANVDFSGANLAGADLRGATLSESTFSGCKYDSNTRFPEFTSGVRFDPKKLEMIQVEDVPVLKPGEAEAKVDISGARRMKHSRFGGVVAEGANFEGVCFPDGRFDYAELRGANFSGVVAQAAQAKGTNFREVNFQGADMRGTSLAGANLSGADLRGANFERAGFMATTVLKGANLCGANLEQIVHRNVDYTGAIYDSHTRWGKTTLVPGMYGVAPTWIAEEHSGATKVDE